jgi:hypothetical protein
MAKQQPSIVIDRLGTHLFQVTNNHTGQVNLKWDWNALLKEVQIATGDRRVQTVEIDVGNASPEEAVAIVKTAMVKKGLIAETEAKVKKTRVKAVEPTKKKPAAKKPSAKKTTK